jgi:Pyruvate/2-oxoacid:ferredoxin oxidoreductase gamma subunit
MTLQSRLSRLEAYGGSGMLNAAERAAAIACYTDTYVAARHAFPSALTPAAYRAAIENTRNPAQQRLLACMLPGDDDI